MTIKQLFPYPRMKNASKPTLLYFAFKRIIQLMRFNDLSVKRKDKN